MIDGTDLQEYCRDCNAPVCVNCKRCLCEECCTTRHVVVVFSDPLPHEVKGERIPLWVCDECRPIVVAELKSCGISGA